MLKFVTSALIVMGLVVSTTSMAFAQYPLPGSAVSNVVAQNLDTVAASDGEIVYYSNSGSEEGKDPNVDMGPKAVRENKTADAPVPSNFNGSAILSSDKQIGAIVSVQYKNVPGDTSDPNKQTQGAYNATVNPATELYFPSVFRFQFIVSRLTIQNVENASNEIELTFTKRDGTAAGTLKTTLNAFGSRTFYLGNASDVPATFPADFVDGSVYVKSLSGRKLAGAAVTTWANRAAAYQALLPANKGKLLYAPSHFRFISNAPANWASLPASSWTLFSALNIQNTSSTDPVDVKLTYTARGANTPSLVKDITIQPLSAAGLNTQNGGDYPASDFNALSVAGNGLPDWDGSVKIEVQNNGPDIVGIVNTNWGQLGYAGAYALVGPADGKSELFLPAQYRLQYTNNGQWSQWSAINLMNVGAGTVNATDIIVEYIDQAGNSIKSFTGAQLPGSLSSGAAFGMNTRNGGDLPASDFNSFPTDNGRPNYIGGIYVKGPPGSQLVAVGNIVYNNRASVYNGVPK